MTLRLIVTAVAAVSLVTTAAFAEPLKKPKKKKRVYTTGQSQPATPEYAHRNDPNAVYYGGTYLGSDPDPSVRANMLREGPGLTGSSD